MVERIVLVDSIAMVVLSMIMLYTGLVVGRAQAVEQIEKIERGEKLDWFDRFMTKQYNWLVRKD